jgi:uncharacterized protein (TIRG00374 family)
MRKFIVVLILFLGIAFIILGFSQLETILKTLQRGKIQFIGLAIVIEAAWFFTQGLTFKSIYRLLGLSENTLRLTVISAAANFVNIVAPSVGVGGVAVFISDGSRRELPSGKVTVAGALFLLADYLAFICVLALGLIILIRRGHLGAGEITASMILLAIASGLAFLIYLGYRSSEALGNMLAKMARLVNRLLWLFLHREYLSEARGHTFAAEISDGLSALPENPRSMFYPVLLALANKTLLMGVLTSAFLAFDVPFSSGTIVAGFAIAYLFLVVTPTPSGIGVVEGVMALALTSLRVDWSQAVVITLTYRAVTLWLPVGVGAWAFRYLQVQAPKPDLA